jgi:phospho-N-acetylmuramoyl-pentapeptide-transferase
MLLALIHWLADSTSLGWLRVFNYLTLRAVLAALTAFYRLGIRPGGDS